MQRATSERLTERKAREEGRGEVGRAREREGQPQGAEPEPSVLNHRRLWSRHGLLIPQFVPSLLITRPMPSRYVVQRSALRFHPHVGLSREPGVRGTHASALRCEASLPSGMLRPMSFAQIFLRLTCLLAGIAATLAQSQPLAPDQFQNCAPCHGGDAQGGEHGPPIAARLLTLDDDELMQIIRGGKPQIGMPAFALSDADMHGLIRYLRTLERPESQPRIRARVPLRSLR